jgi:hypothetical protein
MSTRDNKLLFQLRKIEYIMQKKIRESKQLKSNGAYSRGFEAGLVCKILYALYIVIEVLVIPYPRRLCLKAHRS